MDIFDSNMFCERAIELFGDIGQMELAQKIGISQGVISAIKNKKIKAPGADTVFKISKYFNVSADYLLGLSNVMSLDLDTQAICKKIGCSEKALYQFQKMYDLPQDSPFRNFIDIFYSVEMDDFKHILNNLFFYVTEAVKYKKVWEDYKELYDNGEIVDFELLDEYQEKCIERSEKKDAMEWKLLKSVSYFAEHIASEYEKMEE